MNVVMRRLTLVWLFSCIIGIDTVLAQEVCTAPIDIVYLWVDGNDPEWCTIKDNYLALAITKNKPSPHEDSSTNNRYADHEELRYSLRSLLAYAPFFNHIYIVTMNQRPRWLADHPKVTIVDHTEIFKNREHLPTFNSHAIESNLHRIPHLNEYFIYFNDDVFLGAPVCPSDFFSSEGTIKVLFEPSLSPSGPPLQDETYYRKAWRNTNAFLDALYKKEPRYRLCHSCFALRKSFIEAAEKTFPQIFELNSSHKFRSAADFNIVNGLLHYYWFYNEKVVVGALQNQMVSLRNDNSYNETCKKLEQLKSIRPHTFCLQDVMDEKSNKTKVLLHEFLQHYYPDPAPWEQ